MVTLSKESILVSNAFHKEFDTGDKSYTKRFSREEIQRAISEFNMDSDRGWHNLMLDRAAEIDSEAQYQRERKDKLKDRVWEFIIALIVGSILLWIGSKFFF